MRIVSLLSGATELVCALGAGDGLVGRSHECDFPSWVKRLPCCTAPTFDVSGTSSQIDQLVRQMLRECKPLYSVDGDLLQKLVPDVIITQAHCDVCAVGPADVRRDAQMEELLPSNLVELTAATLEEMFAAFLRVARAIGREQPGEQFNKELKSRLDAISHLVAAERRPSVECLEWIDPIFPMGNWSPDLIKIAGGLTRLGRAGMHSAATEWDRVREADPEYLIVAPCGFDLQRTAAEMPALYDRPGWKSLRAVQLGNLFIVDGNRYFNRSGPSVVDSVEILAEILHPTLLPPVHQRQAWLPWPG